jgi:curved DNA-binding protein CbpA
MKDYYRILNVRQTASAGEIKRSYRLLVLQFHPDVNPDPTAHELIKEINEAYDVLGDEIKRREYDIRLANPFVTEEAQPPPHRDPAYRRRGRYRPAPPTGTTQQDLMQKYVGVASFMAWAGCILCLVLVIDYTLPYTTTRDTVQTFQHGGYGRPRGNYLITYSGRSIKVSAQDAQKFQLGQPVEIIESGMFSILVEVFLPDTNAHITNLGTVYRNFRFVTFFLFVF